MYQKNLSSKTHIFSLRKSKYILVLKESAGSLLFKNVGFMRIYHIKKKLQWNYSSHV